MKPKLFNKIIHLLRGGSNITEIANIIGMSKETVSNKFTEYLKENPMTFSLDKGQRIFKLTKRDELIPKHPYKINLDGTLWMKNIVFTIRLYKHFLEIYSHKKYFYDKDKYFLVDTRLEAKHIRKYIGNKVISISDFKEIVYPPLNSLEIELLIEYYEDIFFVSHGFIIATQNMQLYKIVENTEIALRLYSRGSSRSSRYHMKDIYEALCGSVYGRNVLNKNNISSLETFEKKLKYFKLNQDRFIKVEKGVWQIKENYIADISKNDLSFILKEADELTKKYYNPFNIEVLFSDIQKKTKKENFDVRILKTILLESGKYKHYKSSLILIVGAKNIFSVKDIVQDVLRNNDFLSIEEITKKVRKKGRSISINSARNSIGFIENIVKSVGKSKKSNRQIKLYSLKRTKK